MIFKIGVIDFKETDNKPITEKNIMFYDNIDQHVNNLINDFIEIQKIEVEDTQELLLKQYKDNEIINKYFGDKKLYFEFIHCYENENYCFYHVYPYSPIKKPEKFNVLASFLSRNKEYVYCKSLILKFNIKTEEYEDITNEDLKIILVNRFVFSGVYIDFINNIYVDCSFYSENLNNTFNGPALYIGEDYDIYKIEKSYGQLIVLNNKNDGKIKIEQKLNEKEIENLKLIKEYFEFKEIKNLNNCVCLFYYFHNGYKQIYNVDKEQFIKIIKLFKNDKNLNLDNNLNDENYIFYLLKDYERSN